MIPIFSGKGWSGMVSEEAPVICVDDLLLETIGDVLRQVFGENSAKIILRNMKKSYSLKWEEIPKRAQVFSDALRNLLGSGGVIIEDLILETLYSKLELKFEWKKGYRFSDYIKELRNGKFDRKRNLHK